MNRIFRATSITILGVAAASAGFFACSSTSDTTADGGPGTGDGGGGDGNPANGDGGTGGDGATGARVGHIGLTQGNISSHYFYGASAAFGQEATVSAGTCTTTTMGVCTSVVCPLTDGGAVTPVSTPNAGAITITGMGDAGPAVLTYGAIANSSVMGYQAVNGMSQFFSGGDMITATGAGGADLPSFAAQTVAAPNDITITAPVCTVSGCAPVDRTMDLVVTWTGAGMGNVNVTLESLSDTSSVAVACVFPASGGTGTVPTALLSKLDKAGDPNISGVESIIPINRGTFTVGTESTTFDISAQGAQGLMTVSN